jgi:hypothetical protein
MRANETRQMSNGSSWHSIFDGAHCSRGRIRCAELFARFPIAVLAAG